MNPQEVQDGWKYSTDPDKLCAWWQREVDRERAKAERATRAAETNLAMSRDYEQKWGEALRQHDIIRQKANARTTLDALQEVHSYLRSKFVDGELCKLSKTRREGAQMVIDHVQACIEPLEEQIEK